MAVADVDQGRHTAIATTSASAMRATPALSKPFASEKLAIG